MPLPLRRSRWCHADADADAGVVTDDVADAVAAPTQPLVPR
ncbi:MAG: hypothetical protein SFX73_30490 [Kofleriaceae bacterium]|nr:hypothetical protein [Kofleriaceae bacterium]